MKKDAYRKEAPVKEKKRKREAAGKKGRFGFLQSNKFLMILSVFLALVVWFLMAFTNTEDYPVAVRNVPVSIQLPEAYQEAGLKVFDDQEQTVTVYIKGNSLSVHSVTKDDLQVETLFSSNINEGSTNIATLSVKKVGYVTDFEVDRIEPSLIQVMLDYSGEKTFQIDTSGVKASSVDGYYSSTPVVSPETVKVSGPKSIIDSISSVTVGEKDLSSSKETVLFTSELQFLDANGNQLSEEKMKRLTVSTETADVTVPILMRKTLTITPNFTNLPSGFPEDSGRIILSPSSIEVAGAEEDLQNLTSIELEPIDFTQVDLTNNSLTVPLSLPQGLRNLQSIEDVTIDFNLTGFSSRTFTVDHFRFINVPKGYEAEVTTSSLEVTVVGLSDEISALTEGNIIGTVNLAGKKDFSGYTEMPVSFSVSGTSFSWVTGNHKVNVVVRPESE